MTTLNIVDQQGNDLGIDLENANIYEQWKASRPKSYYSYSINPRGWIYWWWSCIVSLACSYNLIFITLIVFEDVQEDFYIYWIMANLSSDFVYVLDMIALSFLNFYENGCEVVEWQLTRAHYIESWKFLLDTLSILPTDLFLLSSPHFSLLRLNRFLKLYRLSELFDMAYGRWKQEIVSIFKVITICAVMFHWNACGFYSLSLMSSSNSREIANATFDDDDSWPWPYLPQKVTNFFYTSCSHYENDCDFAVFYADEEREEHFLDLYQIWYNKSQQIIFSDFAKKYSLSIYWSALTMTTLGEQPSPNETYQTVFEIFDTVIGVVIFAAIMGSVGDLVQNANKVEAEWRQIMDGLKQYMDYRSLDSDLQKRVLKYCEYEMDKKERMKEMEVQSNLPTKLHSKLNPSLHWNTLAQHEFFKDIEVPFLQDLMTYVIPMDYGPGDVVYSIGDINKEIYIVSSGQLTCYDMNSRLQKEYNNLDVIGARHLIWFQNSVFSNRRSGLLISDDYSEVFVISRSDFYLVLEDYPDLRNIFTHRAYNLQLCHGEIGNERADLENVTDGLGLEEKLAHINEQMQIVEEVVNKQFTKFINTSRLMKMRLYRMESTLRAKQKRRRFTQRSTIEI